MVPAYAFAGAPRLHAGGWAGPRPDEVPAILQRGERVLSRRELAGRAGAIARLPRSTSPSSPATPRASASRGPRSPPTSPGPSRSGDEGCDFDLGLRISDVRRSRSAARLLHITHHNRIGNPPCPSTRSAFPTRSAAARAAGRSGAPRWSSSPPVPRSATPSWANSRRRYDVAYGIRRADDLAAVVAFFEARNGRLHGFRFKDWATARSCLPSGTPSPPTRTSAPATGSRPPSSW
jgi:hypothetical protein